MADTIKPVGAIGRAPEAHRTESPAWARERKDAVTPWTPGGGRGGQRGQADKRAPEADPKPGKGLGGSPRSRSEKRPRVQVQTRPPSPQAGTPTEALVPSSPPGPGVSPGGAEAVAQAGPTVPPGALVLMPEELEAHEQALIEAYREPYLEAAARLDEAARELASRVHEDIVELAARLAQALLHRAIKEDRTIMLEVLQRAFRLAGPLEHVTVRCSSEDADMLRERAPGLARAETGRAVDVVVRPSDDISPGGCVLTWEGGVVDARNERRLDRIVDAVRTALAEASNTKAAAAEAGEPPRGPTP